MSRFGDEREAMNEWSASLQQRADEVGARQAVQEFAEVLATFAEYYWPKEARNG